MTKPTELVFSDAFRRIAARIEGGAFPQACRIPRPVGLYERLPRMHYHHKPEVFIQIAGTTEFTFPDERFTLRPGEICILPKALPHGETAHSEGERFENIVVSFYNEMIDLHVAHEVEGGFPAADEVHFIVTDLYADLVSLLDRVCDLHHADPELHQGAIKGLLLAEFSLLANLVEAPPSLPAGDLIGQAQRLVQRRLHEDDLRLESIAADLRCSPNYLSKAFHRRVGERLVEYINRLRVQQSIDALRHSQLSVKTVAAACGFSDANYFSRVFRQATGRSPRQFRTDFQRVSRLRKLPPMSAADAHAVDASVTIEGDGMFRDAQPLARLGG